MTRWNPDLNAALADALDAAPFGFCLFNPGNGAILARNDIFSAMAGRMRQLEKNTGHIRHYIPGSDLKVMLSQTRRSFDHELSVQALPGQPGDQTRYIRLHGEYMTHEGERVCALWVHDITGEVAAEDRNAAALKAMETAAEMKANLLATMSHEIRTPMQSVFGFLELIAEEKPDQKIMDMVGTARSSASDLLEILDDVLDLARLDADRMELDDFEIPLRTLAYGIIEALEVKKYGSAVDLRADIESDVPFVVKGDPKRLRQILVNLMGNSLKFTREGSVTLRILVKDKDEDGDGLTLRFEVADTGIGMSEEVCARLFQPFVQADNSTARQFGGTGLGLSICRKLVALMGGAIGVTSTEGEGSVFWFEIPTLAVSTDQTTVQLPSLDGLAVLVVEDHPRAIVEISNSLRSMGAEVEACATYAEGFDLIQRRPFDAAVVDQGLPDGLGLNLIREINDIRPYCGLVMYTVHDDYSIQNALRGLGAVHLLKPASRAGLGEAVKGVVKQIAAHSLEGPQKILIAEDTEAVRQILDQQLRTFGIEADFVENGAKALEALATGRYGILFTDLHMPETDGYAVIREIRERERREGTDKRFPVIVLTADVQMAQRQTYMDLGFDECLLKPVSLAQVRRLMMRWGLLPESIPASSAQEKEKPKTVSAKDEETPIHLPGLEEMLGSLDSMAADMMGMFVDMSAPLIADLKDALANNDARRLSETGHSLKGSARSICANRLGDICAAIQDEAESADQDRRKALVDQADQAFEQVKVYVAHIRETGFPGT